jgi:hypothetical protein
MMLLLRGPRLEEQTMPGVRPACEIMEIWVGQTRPDFPETALGVIRPGELLSAILMNHSAQLRNVCVVVEGDEVRLVHWAVDCPHKTNGGCQDCRWRTRCFHDECERSPEMERRCHSAREEEELRKLATAQNPIGKISNSTALWRPWNPLGR